MWLLLVQACSLGGPADLTEPPLATASRPDVVLITVDTTRADHLGCYGYAGAQTPTIDHLAATGVRYAHAYSPIPLTIPAHSSLFTGLYPYHHHIRENGDNLLADTFTTLAERFQGMGYDTAASVAAFVTTRQWGLAQGFDAYYDELPEVEQRNFWHLERPGDQVVDDALRWLGGHPPGTPVFLWVHLYDAHYPYQTHPDQAPELAARPYDSELAFVDRQIARVVDAFADRETLFVVMGDHGEALGEHHESTHGLFTYDATQHVPWIVSGAGVKAGVVDQAVSTVSLTATLLHALGQPLPDGLDAPVAPSPDAVAYSESWQLPERFRMAPAEAVVGAGYRLLAFPRPELYDIHLDPSDQHDVAADHPDVVASLRARLDALAATPPGEESNTLDAATIAQLAALGYVGGSTKGVDVAALPDPKDYLDILDTIDQLDRNTGHDAEAAVDALQAIIRRKPDTLEARFRQLPLLQRLDRSEDARALLEETANRFPESARVWVSLSGMAQGEGDIPTAIDYARRGLAAEPGNTAAEEQLVALLFGTGKDDEEALRVAEAGMAKNPRNYGLAAELGRYYLTKGRYQDAARMLAVAVQSPNPTRGSRTQLAWLAIAAGQTEDAYKLLDAEVKDYPRYARAHRLLGLLYGREQLWADQLPHLQAVAQAAPGDPQALRAVAQCLFNLKRFGEARTVLDSALGIAPDDPDVLLLHANLLAKEGRRDEGAQVFQRASALNEARVAAHNQGPAAEDLDALPAEPPR